jgi:hypothetical protein
MVEVTVRDSAGNLHTLGPISIPEDSEVDAVNFEVKEQGMTTCPGAESTM